MYHVETVSFQCLVPDSIPQIFGVLEKRNQELGFDSGDILNCCFALKKPRDVRGLRKDQQVLC